MAATAFLHDLEAVFASGRAAETVGDVCLKHVSEDNRSCRDTDEMPS